MKYHALKNSGDPTYNILYDYKQDNDWIRYAAVYGTDVLNRLSQQEVLA